MISIFLCDDEPVWLKRMEKAIMTFQMKNNWEANIEYKTNSSDQFLQYLTKHPPVNGIYFLDIDLKSSVDGLELATRIRTMDSRATIIFVTTHDELVLETFRLKLSVLDYIVKDSDDLENQIEKCLDYLMYQYLNTQSSRPDTITFHSHGSYNTFSQQEIYYVESVKNTHKICLHLRSGFYHIPLTLCAVQKQLGENFVQCHKAFLVNLQHIDKLVSSTHNIVLDNGDSVPCSVREWSRLMKKFMSTIGK